MLMILVRAWNVHGLMIAVKSLILGSDCAMVMGIVLVSLSHFEAVVAKVAGVLFQVEKCRQQLSVKGCLTKK